MTARIPAVRCDWCGRMTTQFIVRPLPGADDIVWCENWRACYQVAEAERRAATRPRTWT